MKKIISFYKEMGLFLKIFSIVIICSVIAGVVALASLKFIPGYLVALVIMIHCIICALIMKGLITIKNRYVKVIIYCISIMYICVVSLFLAYIFSFTSFFSNITVDRKDYEEYVLVARKHKYESLSDVKGELSSVYEGDKYYDAAAKKVQDKLHIKCNTSDNIMLMKERLESGHNNLLLCSSNTYKSINEKDTTFNSKTEILYRFKVFAKDGKADIDSLSKETFSVLISGMDSWGSMDKKTRSDVNMVITINQSNKSMLITSIPRDAYIEYPLASGNKDKITHVGLYGVGESKRVVEDLLNCKIDYTVKINFNTVKELIDSLGGIDVNSDYDFDAHGQKYKGHFDVGINHLNGEQALAFARERKSFSDGDLQRNKNQQKIIKAVVDKVTKNKETLISLPHILNSIEPYVQLDAPESLVYELIKNEISNPGKWIVKTSSVTGSSASLPCYSLNNQYASVVILDDKSVLNAREEISRMYE